MSASILNGQIRKCAQCGKEFRIYGLVNMWVYKKNIQRENTLYVFKQML